jgi:hypothetical protein
MKKQLSLEQEALVLAYLEYHHGKQMKGDTRVMMYDIYRIFQQDRDSSICSCLDRDTFRKVEGFINNIEWSEETRQSPKMKQLLPNLYLEPIQIEEESTQPVEVDMAKLEKAIKRRKRIKKDN